MSKSNIKHVSLRLSLMVVTLFFLLISNTISAQSRRELKRQARELSYQKAGDTSSDAVSEKNAKKRVKKGSVDPNAMVVRGVPQTESISRLTPLQQKICSLTNKKAELQVEIDELGERLQKSRGSKARKITEELEVLAEQMSLINLQLEALPREKSLSEVYTDDKPFHNLVDSLVDSRIEMAGYLKEDRAASYVSPQIVYHVQLSVTSRPNIAAFSNISGVVMQQRPDGKYAYYYGNYSNYKQAQSACMRLRTGSQYRDAFVVALRGAERISVQQAAILLNQ